MQTLRIYLFGRFRTRWDARPLQGLEARKVQELLGFLLLNRNRPHAREPLAALFWQDGTAKQQRGYLRKALWQLQDALPDRLARPEAHLLEVEPEWVRLRLSDHAWLDTDAFESAFEQVKGLRGDALDAPKYHTVRRATALYQGELLEGWYQDWCLCERERFLYMYLAMLDKLVDYHASRGEYEQGVDCGFRILHCDRAHERTHRKLMRIYYLAGNRTAALRQFRRCRQALWEDLEVEPTHRTEALHQLIRSDNLDPEAASETAGFRGPVRPGFLSPRQALARLEAFPDLLQELQHQLLEEVKALRGALRLGDSARGDAGPTQEPHD